MNSPSENTPDECQVENGTPASSPTSSTSTPPSLPGVSSFRSSRQQYGEYLDSLKTRIRDKSEDLAGPPHGHHGAHRSRPKKPRVRSTWTLLSEFWRVTRRERTPLIFSLATLTVSALLGLIPPAATKFIVDHVLTDNPIPNWIASRLPASPSRWNLLLSIALLVVTISLIRILIGMWGRWFATRSTKRIQMQVRKRVFEHSVRLPLQRIHELKSGGVASLLREDAGGVGDLVFGLLYNPWRAIIQLLGSLCILAWVDWQLLLGALILIPAIFGSHLIWVSRIRPMHRDVRLRREAIDAHATEAFGGMRVVRAFGRQKTESIRFIVNNHVMGRQELGLWWWFRSLDIAWQLLVPLGSAAMMLYGGYQVLQGRLSIGDLMMFLAYLLMLLEPLTVLAESATAFQNSLSALDRVLDVLAEPTEMVSSPSAINLRKPQVRGAVAFNDVTFRYTPQSSFALSSINLTIHPGETIALVGPSGAGKTTLCNLVARFYDPQQGSITLDGRDLRDIRVESYRKLLGVVEQDVFLFDGTIAENIGYSDRRASRDAIIRAARIAHADEFIEKLPQGYDTLIGERGVKLSGGQRQRIAIARAVLADPRILILDEATSNLDTHSEKMIQRSLVELMKGRTCFVIAHRLSTIRNADRIAVMRDGKIIQLGSHDELMENEGLYRDMVQMQTLTEAEVLEAM